MSLLFFDSFKNYTFLPLKWEERTKHCLFSIEEGYGRKGGAALVVHSAFTDKDYDHLGKVLPGNYEEVIVGFAFKKIKIDLGSIEIDFNDGDSMQSRLNLFNTNFLWYSGDNINSYGLYHSLKLQEWNYVEIKLKTHTVSGTLDIRINEHLAVSLVDINTSYTGNNYINKIRFRNKQTLDTAELYAVIEDLYIADTSGSINNDFLGNCEVVLAYPNSQGYAEDFVESPIYSGVENYTLINEPIHIEDDVSIYNNTFFEHDSADDGFCQVTTFDNTSTSTEDFMLTSALQFLWCRFSGINIPRNAKIIQATINFYVNSRYISNTYGTLFRLGFQKSGIPVSQVTTKADMESREMTDSKIMSYVYIDEPTSFDYKNSLQELVSRHDWQENNNSVLWFMYGGGNSTGSSSTSRYDIRTYDYYNDPYNINSPHLFVEWQLPGGDRDEYIYSEYLNEKEFYTINTLSGTTDIFAVSRNMFTKRALDRADPNDMSLSPLITISGTTYSGIGILPNDLQYKCTSVIDDKNPSTGTAWTSSDLENAQFGFVTTISG